MNREELEALKPNELYQTAKDLGIKTKKKTPAEVVTLILDSVAGTLLQEDDGDEAETIPADGDLNADIDEGNLTGEAGAGDDAEEPDAPLEEVGDVPKLTATDKQFIKKNPDLDARIKAEKEHARAMPPVATPGYTGQEPHRAVQAHNPAVRHGQHWPTVEEVKVALKSHLARGLKIIELHDDQWHFRIEGREAAGNLKMPLNQIVFQANILMRPTKTPTEN